MNDAYADRLQRAKDKLIEERARRKKETKEQGGDDASYVSYGSFGSFASEISRSSRKRTDKGPRSEWRNKAREVIERGKTRKEAEMRDEDGVLSNKSFNSREREEQIESLVNRNAHLNERERMLNVENKLLDAAEAEAATDKYGDPAGFKDSEQGDEAAYNSYSDSDSNGTENTETAVFSAKHYTQETNMSAASAEVNRSFQEAVAVWEGRCSKYNSQEDSDSNSLKKNNSMTKNNNKKTGYATERRRSNSLHQRKTPSEEEFNKDQRLHIPEKTENSVDNNRGRGRDRSSSVSRGKMLLEREYEFKNEAPSSPASVKSEYRVRSRPILGQPRVSRYEFNDDPASPVSVKSEYIPSSRGRSVGASPRRQKFDKLNDEAESPMSARSERVPNKVRMGSSPLSSKSEVMLRPRGQSMIPDPPRSQRSHRGKSVGASRKQSKRRRSIRSKSPVAMETFRREQLSVREQSPQLSYRQSSGSVSSKYDEDESYISYHEEIYSGPEEGDENAAPKQTSELMFPSLMEDFENGENTENSQRPLSYREKNAILASMENIQRESEAEDRPPIRNIFASNGGGAAIPKKSATQLKKNNVSVKSEKEQKPVPASLSVFKEIQSDNTEVRHPKETTRTQRPQEHELSKLVNENRELKSRLEKERTRRTQLDDKTTHLQLEVHQKGEEITKLRRRDDTSTVQKDQIFKLEDAVKQTNRRLDSVVNENTQLRSELDKERARSARLLDQTKTLQQQVNKKSDEVVALAKELKRKDDKFNDALHEERTLREIAESQLEKACHHLNNSEHGRDEEFEELEKENCELRHAIERLEMYLKQKIRNDQRAVQHQAAMQERRLVAFREEDEEEEDTDHDNRRHRKVRASPQAITSKPTWTTAVSEITTDFDFDELNESQMGEI